MEDISRYLIFMLDHRLFALPLDMVERVERAVEITPLPQVPDIVPGIINYKGTVLPVCDIRPRFQLPQREIRLEDQLIIVKTIGRTIALLVDTVTDNIEKPSREVVPPPDIADGAAYLAGILKLEDGIALIPDLNKILTPQEDRALAKAMKRTKQ
ncbi:MAG: chemotaxis protein CheW [Candidatus Aminicenantes bacterium]|nr:chemotaxis protein CheW [Candidatus Aminicenantes bacterium]